MRDKASPGTWLSWLTVSIGGSAMVGVFALAGGVGGGQPRIASAVAANTSSSSTNTSSASSSAVGGNPTVNGISTPSCAGNTLTGAIRVDDKFTGTVTVGLFAISDPESPFVRSFTDTGMRATVTFKNAFRGPFIFAAVPEGPGGYLVAVIPESGTFDADTQLAESSVIPSCNTTTTTLTNTATVTATATTVVTFTQIHFTTITENVVHTGTVTANTCTITTETTTTTTTTTNTVVPVGIVNPLGNAGHPAAYGSKLRLPENNSCNL